MKDFDDKARHAWDEFEATAGDLGNKAKDKLDKTRGMIDEKMKQPNKRK